MRLVEAAGCPRSSPAEGKGRLRPGPFRPPHPGSPDDRPEGPESAPPLPRPCQGQAGTGSPRDAGGPPPSALGRGDRPPAGLRALGRSFSPLQSVAVVPVRDKAGEGLCLVSSLLRRGWGGHSGTGEGSSWPCWTGAVEFVLWRHKQKLKRLPDSARTRNPPRGQNGAERSPKAPAAPSKTGSGLFLSGSEPTSCPRSLTSALLKATRAPGTSVPPILHLVPAKRGNGLPACQSQPFLPLLTCPGAKMQSSDQKSLPQGGSCDWGARRGAKLLCGGQ